MYTLSLYVVCYTLITLSLEIPTIPISLAANKADIARPIETTYIVRLTIARLRVQYGIISTRN